MRPRLPPLLVAGLVLWATTAFVWPQLADAPAALMGALALGGAGGALALCLGCLLARRIPLKALVGLCVGAGLALSGAHGIALVQAGSSVSEERSWTCTLSEDAKEGSFGWYARADAVDERGRRISVRVQLPDDGLRWLQGDRLAVAGAIREPSASSRNGFWEGGLVGTLSGTEGKRLTDDRALFGLRSRAIDLLEAYGGEGAGLPAALVCGYRPLIEAEGLYDAFKTVGLAHLVAVSGAHLSIVTMFVAGGLRLLRLGRRSIAVASALFLAGYVCFTGMPVSALRAALMAATGLLGLVIDRRRSSLAALGLCLVLFVGTSPPCAVSASFVLSAGSTLGIVLFAAPFAAVAGRAGSRLRRLVGDPLGLTAASAVATQPYAGALFSQLPLLSPLANMVGAPLFTIACVTGFLAVLGACLASQAAPWLIGVAVAACVPLSWAVSVLASLPGTCLPLDASVGVAALLSVALCAALWLWWPKSFRAPLAGLGALVAALLLLPGAVPLHAADEIVMLDVGQGDSFLVRSQGHGLLIDTGNQDALLREACAREGIRALDGVAVTHHDDDHCGSLPALGDVTLIDALYVADGMLSCPCEGCSGLRATAAEEHYPQGVIGLRTGDTIACGRFTLRVLWPDRLTDEGSNADSLTLLCSYDGNGDGTVEWTTLFCGDAESEQLAAMAERLPAFGVDVLKVGHHGSRKALDEATASLLAPSVALIGVGERNRYGHPSSEALALLDSVGCETYCSDETGDVAVRFSVEKLTVTSQKRGADP